jgi:curved DNA-binding protein CbpA
MNPYAILGVSTNATDLEIKRAYRNLVKRYHPDKQSAEASHDQIAAINHAYDILSDPEERARYDRGFAAIFVVPEEDPVEAYKREFKRKRWEREKKEKEQKLARKKAIYRVMQWIHIPVLVFGVGLMLNDWIKDEGIVFFHLVMSINAGYICYQRECSDFTYKLSQFTLFMFVMTLLVTFG